MSDEYTIDAKYKRDSLIDEHFRYERALEKVEKLALRWSVAEGLSSRPDVAAVAREALNGSQTSHSEPESRSNGDS